MQEKLITTELSKTVIIDYLLIWNMDIVTMFQNRNWKSVIPYFVVIDLVFPSIIHNLCLCTCE